jgi:hypothetical protein
MKYTKPILTALLLGVSASIVSAKLGDTVQESNRRYHKQGAPFDTNYGRSVVWIAAGWNIQEWFDEGICTMIAYSRTDNGWPTNSEIDTLLANNSGNGSWAKTPKPVGGTEWINVVERTCAKYYMMDLDPVNGKGRKVTRPTLRFATAKALAARGLLLPSDDDNESTPPSDVPN